MSNRILILSLVILGGMFSGAVAEVSSPDKSAFMTYIDGDGSSLAQALIIKDVEGIDACYSDDCLRAGFTNISEQEYRYFDRKFGQRGTAWKLEGRDNWEVDIERNDKFYDKVAIRLLPSQERKIFYFDITVAVLKLRGRD